MSAGPADAGTLWSRGFVLTNVANVLFFTGVTTFFVLPVHLESLGASRAEVGHVMGSFGFASIVAIPTTGLLVDRLGRRPFMVIGGVLWALTAALFSTVTGLGPALYGLRMMQGLAFALAFVASNAVVVDLAPRGALGRAIAIFGTTTLVTHALGPTVAELILRHLGFRSLCALSASGATLATVVYTFIPEPPRSVHRPKPGGPAPGLVSLALRPRARSALGGGVTSALAFGTAMNFMPIFALGRGLPSFSPFFEAYVVSAIFVRVAAGGLGDRIGYRKVALVSLGFFGCIVAAMSLVHRTPVLVALALAFGLAHGFAYPSLNALFVEDAPPEARGRAMALFNLSFNLGVTLAAFTGGEVAERLGYSAMWLIAGGLSLLGVVALVVDRGPGARRV